VRSPAHPDEHARAPRRTREYVGGESVELVTYGGPMGEDVAREADFDPVVVGNPENFEETDETTAADTRRLCGRSSQTTSTLCCSWG